MLYRTKTSSNHALKNLRQIKISTAIKIKAIISSLVLDVNFIYIFSQNIEMCDIIKVRLAVERTEKFRQDTAKSVYLLTLYFGCSNVSFKQDNNSRSDNF